MKNLVFAVAWLLAVCTAFADRVDSLVKQEMKKHDIPGVALTIIKNGKPIKTAGYGFSNLELKTSVTKETVFEIGSVTKQFTAAGIMLLVQEGKISVDDPISKYLKDTPPSWANIRIRNLLTHTSGIKTYTGLDGFEFSRHLTQEEFIKKLGAMPLDFEPGDSWFYSNSGFNLLGFIIENVSGKKYWDYMGERIFGPVGMNATTNRDPSILVLNRADGYEKNLKGQRINRDYDLTDIFSAGAIVSTVTDMAKWDLMLDTDKILTEESKQRMWTVTKLNSGKIKEYGFAWDVGALDGHKNIGHSGSTSGFSASFQRFPNDKLAVIVLTNSGENGIGTRLAKEIAKAFFADSVAKK